MQLQLRPALPADVAFCESLSHSNMAAYLATRGIPWDPERYVASWGRFETHVILADSLPVGVLQLLVVDGALEIRDLQLAPTHRGLGIGTWAVAQVKSSARARGLGTIRLRVYMENPARDLYARLGFTTDAINDGVVHMSFWLSPDDALEPRFFPGST